MNSLDIVEKNVRARSDAELYAMLRLQRDDWSEDALRIAEDEFTRRSLDEKQFAQAVSTAHERVSAKEAEQSAPLGKKQRVAFFLLGFAACFGIPIVMAYLMYKMRGYDRKYSDATTHMAYGFSLFCVIVIVMMFIRPR